MKDNKDIVNKRSDISQNWESLVRSIFGIIPSAGTALNEVFFNNRARKHQARINEWVPQIAQLLERISQDKIGKEYLLSEEFQDIFFSTLRKVATHGIKERQQYFKNLLLNQINLKEESSFVETFLTLLTQLSPKQILLLKQYQFHASKIEEAQKRIREKQNNMMQITYRDSNDWSSIMKSGSAEQVRKAYDRLLSEFLDNSHVPSQEAYLYSIDLVSKYLLTEVSDLKYYGDNKYFKITPYGNRFLAFVTNNKKTES